MESEKGKKIDEEKLDFYKIIARYRTAISKDTGGASEEKPPAGVEKETAIGRMFLPKAVQPPVERRPSFKEMITGEDVEKYFEWVKIVESAIQNCISQSKGVINSIYVLLPDDITCLGFGSQTDLDEDVIAAFIGEQFELLESYDSILQIGKIDEIEYTGKNRVILMKSGSGLRLMALLNDKSYVRLAKIYLERVLKSIPRLE